MENAFSQATTSPEQLRSIARLWMEQIWQKRDLTKIDQLHAAEFKDRSPSGRESGRDAYRAGIVELFAAFPDFHAQTEDLVVDASAGKVAIRWTAAGTHKGTFLRCPPTDQRLTFRGIEIIRIENDRIVERWCEWDGLGLLAQLNANTAVDESSI